jgi:hypothetical protein
VAVIVQAVDDDIPDGNQICTIQTTASSADSRYNNISVDDVSVTVGDDDAQISLPIIMKDAGPPAPDLMVEHIVATTNQVQVTIRNVGPVAVNDAFWVDVYFNPGQTPVLNKPWKTIAPAGVVWGVTKSLAPNETLVLTTGGNYYLGLPDSSAPPFPVGAQVYVYADSVNYTTTYGNVQEGNEGNNLFGPVVSTAGIAGATPPESGPLSSMEELPKR